MSLIHEALRRADEDQRGQSAGVPASAPPVLPSDDPQTVPHRRSPWLVPLAAVLVILVGVATYAVWWGIGAAREQAGLAVRSAAAGLEKAAGTAVAESLAAAASGPVQPTAPADVTAAEAPTSAEETPASVAEAAATDAGTGTGAQAADAAAAGTEPTDAGEADLAGGWTPDLLLKTPAEGPTPTEQAAAGRPDPALLDRMLTVLEAAAREAARRQAEAAAGPSETAAASPGTAPTAVSAGGASAAPGQPDRAADGPKQAPAQAAPKAPASETEPVIDIAQYKISSIMVGPHGGLAVINGRPVRVGDTILGATVVAITSRSVEVEKDGRRATIGL